MNDRLSPFWQTPVGWIAIGGGSAGIEEIAFHVDADSARRLVECRILAPDLLPTVRRQIDEYFNGERQNFDLPLVYPARSPFVVRVLEALRQIPFGATVTYGELARRSGYPLAARAVGGVMARNPFPLVIPCHRVVGAGGKMTGYSGGKGIASKEWLLQFESQVKRKKILLQ